jgi:riboflavin kinase/FMN adenylyltransferase
MVVYRSLAEVEPHRGGRSIALGTFDGVHRGHRRVIGTAVEHARERALRPIVVTFDPHPLRVLRPADPPPLLTDTVAKAEIAAGLGAEELLAIPFTKELSQMEPEDFVADVLVGTLGTRQVSVGANFHFGRGARGDVVLLRSRPEFQTTVVPLVEYGDSPVSSSRIRELIAEGDVVAAADLLGAPYRMEGEVVSGDARGRELDMRTANVAPAPGVLIPRAGIYAATARVEGREVAAAVSIGVRPTFEDAGDMRIEAHLIGWEGDLYGRRLRLSFLERLRDEVKFDSAEDLQRQMREDVQQVERIAAR